MAKYQDAIIAVVLIGLAGFVVYETMNISAQYSQRASGMVYYPLLLSALFAAASLLLLVKSLVRPGGASEAEGEGGPGSGAEAESNRELGGDTAREPAVRTFAARVLPVLLGIAILATYVLALAILGFVASTPVMLVALLLAYGVRNWKVIASLAVGTTAVIYLIFYYILAIQLP